jgi:hypothetical protein
MLVAVAVAVACSPAAAQLLYKLIDKNGKVTYVDKVPQNYDGRVIPLDVDKKRNTATLNAPAPATPSPLTDRMRAGELADQNLKAAQERLAEARKELEAARENPQEGDVQRVGKVGGGTRPVHTPEYDKRIAALEVKVKAAEEEVRRLEKAR